MNNIQKAVGLTNVFISLPSKGHLLMIMLIVGLLFGVLALLLSGETDLTNIFRGALEGLFLLFIPAIFTSILIKIMIRRIPFKHILAASLVGQILYGIAYLFFVLFSSSHSPYGEALLFFVAACAFAIWFVVARFVFILKWRAFLFAALQTILYGFFLLSGKIILLSDGPTVIIGKFFLASVVLLGFIYLFFHLINAPMKRTFNLNTLDAISLFLAHWFYESKDIEGEFERVGEEAETILSAFIFKTKNKVIAFVVPYVHYGPFGSLGGSNFSHLIAEELKKRYKMEALVFHGTVTHDLNPVASDELEKIISAFDNGYKHCKFSKSKIGFLRGFFQDCFAESLIFRDCAFVGISRAPNTTEDVNFGLGLAMMGSAEKFIPSVSVIDQHNAETGEITSFEPGSKIGFNYMRAITDALAKKPKMSELKIGISQIQHMIPSIGPAGIKIAVFSSTPSYVIVLLDSNGVEPKLREKIISEIKGINANLEVGIYTTDTHAINTVRGVLNPLKEDDTLIHLIMQGVREAFTDVQSASTASFKTNFSIHVLGAKQSIGIISTVNAIIAVAKISAPLIIIGSMISILWLVSKV